MFFFMFALLLAGAPFWRALLFSREIPVMKCPLAESGHGDFRTKKTGDEYLADISATRLSQ
jgi:hypothetical protein